MTTLRMIWIVLLIISALTVLQVKNYVRNLDQEIAKIDNDIRSSNELIHVLEAEWSYLNNPIRLEKLSSKYLNNTIAKSNQLINHKMNEDNGIFYKVNTLSK